MSNCKKVIEEDSVVISCAAGGTTHELDELEFKKNSNIIFFDFGVPANISKKLYYDSSVTYYSFPDFRDIINQDAEMKKKEKQLIKNQIPQISGKLIQRNIFDFNASVNISRLIPMIKTKDTLLIVFCGSRLGKQYSQASDYDFFIITKRTSKLLVLNRQNNKIECFYYSEKRLANCIKSNDHIVVDAISLGKPVYVKNKRAEKIFEKITKIKNNYKLSAETLLRFKYRFEMVEEKLIGCNDEKEIRWIIIFALPYLLRFFYHYNHKTAPSLKYWPKQIDTLKNVPENLELLINNILGISPCDYVAIKNNVLSVIKFIKNEIGPMPKKFEILSTENDQTTVI